MKTQTTAHDRCDRCGSRAYVIVTVPVPAKVKDCALRFCAHHYRNHEAKLAQTATVVVDSRELLATPA